MPHSETDDLVDLVAVQADDQLISALAAGMSVSSPGLDGYDADDHMAAILAAWKADVDATPIPELVDVELAAATIASATRPKVGRARHLAPVAAAAAVIVMAIGGLSVGSYDSRPGDALWGVSKVLYSERAKSVEAAARVETAIDSAKWALLKGDPDAASKELRKAAADIPAVRSEEGKETYAEVQTFLAAKADETPPGQPAKLSAPLAKSPDKRVPAEAAKMPPPPPGDPGTSSTTSTGSGGGSAGNDPRTLGTNGGATSTTTPVPSPKPTTEGGPSGTVSPSPTATPEGGPSTTGMGSTGTAGDTTPAGSSTPPS